MKAVKKFKTFQVHAGTYDFGINFCITSDVVRAVKWINFKLETNFVTIEDLSCLGKRIFRYGYCPIIWIPKPPKTPEEIGTLSHEIFHVVCDCMRWAAIPLTNDTEEAYCHLIKHITKKTLEKLSKFSGSKTYPHHQVDTGGMGTEITFEKQG